jgi:uncharacterized membrane-anchored protein YhcB (DUF1043 family)
MEIVYLVVGLGLGFLIAWLIFKSKGNKIDTSTEIANQFAEAQKQLAKYESANELLLSQITELKSALNDKDAENRELIAALNVSETNLNN